MSRPIDRLFERRQAQRERTEILIAYDSSGGEEWVDLQDYLDRMLIVPDLLVTIAEFKKKWTPADLAAQPSQPEAE